MEPEFEEQAYISVLVLSSSIVVALIVGLIFGSLLVILCCKIKRVSKKYSEGEDSGATPSRPLSTPIYEDINMDNLDNINLSQNIAYEQVKTSSN